MQPKLPCGHFFGRLLQSRSLPGLILSETTYAPRTRLPKHSHENAYFCLVRQGAYQESYGGRTRSCGPLTLAFHPPGEVHAEEFGEGPSRSFNVEIEPGWINRFSLPASLLDGWADTRGGPLASLALRLYREFRQPDAVSSLAVEGLMLELFAVAFREKASTIKQPPPWLKRTWEMVQTRFAEPLALGDVAAEVGVHPVHLAATFRRTYHCTVGEAIRRRRVEFASHQLAHSDAPLAVIALEAGFADQSHFCNVFKRQVGLSPAEFRRSLRTP